MVDRTELIIQARQRGLALAAELGINFVLPFIVYSAMSGRYGEVTALIASSMPPLMWSAVELARKRRIDVISMIVLVGIALSVLGYFGGGGPRMLQLREKLATGVMGAVFLGSAIIGRPLIYELARAGLKRRSSDALADFEARRADAPFRRTMMVMTVVWGVGLLADVAIGAGLIFLLSVREYLIVGPVAGYIMTGGLSAWTFLYARQKQREGESRRAATPLRSAPASRAALLVSQESRRG